MNKNPIDGIKYARDKLEERRAREDKENTTEEVAGAILFQHLGGPATRASSRRLWKKHRNTEPSEQIESD